MAAKTKKLSMLRLWFLPVLFLLAAFPASASLPRLAESRVWLPRDFAPLSLRAERGLSPERQGVFEGFNCELTLEPSIDPNGKLATTATAANSGSQNIVSSLNIPYTSPQQYQQMQSFLSPPQFDINAYSPPLDALLGQNTPTAPSNPGTISAALPPPYTYQDLLLGAPNLVGTPMGYQIAQGNALNYMTTPGTAIIGNAVTPILNSIFADTAAADSQIITVVGSGRDVAPYVGRPGFNTFTGAGIARAELDTQNALWLNSAIQRGDQIWLVTDPEAHAAFLENLPSKPQSAYLNLELPMLNQYSGVNTIPKYVTGAAH